MNDPALVKHVCQLCRNRFGTSENLLNACKWNGQMRVIHGVHDGWWITGLTFSEFELRCDDDVLWKHGLVFCQAMFGYQSQIYWRRDTIPPRCAYAAEHVVEWMHRPGAPPVKPVATEETCMDGGQHRWSATGCLYSNRWLHLCAHCGMMLACPNDVDVPYGAKFLVSGVFDSDHCKSWTKMTHAERRDVLERFKKATHENIRPPLPTWQRQYLW